MPQFDLETTLKRIRPGRCRQDERRPGPSRPADQAERVPGPPGGVRPALRRHHRPRGYPQKSGLHLRRRPRRGRGGGERLSPRGHAADGAQLLYRRRGDQRPGPPRRCRGDGGRHGGRLRLSPRCPALVRRKVARGTGQLRPRPGHEPGAGRCSSLEAGIALARLLPSGAASTWSAPATWASATPPRRRPSPPPSPGCPSSGHPPRHGHRRCRPGPQGPDHRGRPWSATPPTPQTRSTCWPRWAGFEIGGIAGLVLGCAAWGLPVVVDGFISTAGALIASRASSPRARLSSLPPTSRWRSATAPCSSASASSPSSIWSAPRRGDRRRPGHEPDRGGPARAA